MSGLELLAAGLGALGTVASGVAANRAAQGEAKEETAAAQREAMQKRREGALINSRQQALAAASGGGADDPTIVKLMTDVASESEYNAGTVAYGGQSRALGLRDAVQNRRREGKASLLG